MYQLDNKVFNLSVKYKYHIHCAVHKHNRVAVSFNRSGFTWTDSYLSFDCSKFAALSPAYPNALFPKLSLMDETLKYFFRIPRYQHL